MKMGSIILLDNGSLGLSDEKPASQYYPGALAVLVIGICNTYRYGNVSLQQISIMIQYCT